MNRKTVLLIDIGNTTTVIGVLEFDQIIHSFRVSTSKKRPADEWAALLIPLLQNVGISKDDIKGIVVSSVVPAVDANMKELAKSFFCCEYLFVEPGIKTGISIKYKNPAEVGADRVVNAVAAKEMYGVPAIVVDFGTAITFDLINFKGDYIGGVIFPGVSVGMKALATYAAKLYEVDLDGPTPPLIGASTTESIRSGILNGYLELIKGLLTRLKLEIGAKVVVATGGDAQLFKDICPLITFFDEDLTLKGLKIIYFKNVNRFSV